MRAIARSAQQWGREALLTLGALLGVVCIIVAIASLCFGIKPYVVMSGSMSPAIAAGDLVLAKHVSTAEVEVGDVVTVDVGGDHVTHRVESIEPNGDRVALVLKGDANETADPTPYAVATADVVVFDVPRAGYVVGWLQSPLGLALSAGLVLLALAVIVRPTRSRGAVAIGVALAVALGASTGGRAPSSTAAYFTDGATLDSASLGAATVSAPASASCTAALLSATVSWPADPRYDYTVALRRVSNNALVSTRQVTGNGNSVTYTGLTDFGLVVGLLAVDFRVEIRSYVAGVPTWISPTARSYTNISVLALVVGATATCTT